MQVYCFCFMEKATKTNNNSEPQPGMSSNIFGLFGKKKSFSLPKDSKPNSLRTHHEADREPGLAEANYVGRKLPFSVSNAQLPVEAVWCRRTEKPPGSHRLSIP